MTKILIIEVMWWLQVLNAYKFIDIVPPSHFLISAGCDAASWIMQQWWNNAINYTKSPWNRFQFWLTSVHRGCVECFFNLWGVWCIYMYITCFHCSNSLFLGCFWYSLFSFSSLFGCRSLHTIFVGIDPPLLPIQIPRLKTALEILIDV